MGIGADGGHEGGEGADMGGMMMMMLMRLRLRWAQREGRMGL